MNKKPEISLIQYLPEVYREQVQQDKENFLEKFLSIFEGELNNLDETISRIPGFFDPLTAPGDFIPWLAQWFSLDLYELLGEKNREFILRAFEFYKKKGTLQGIEELVTLLTGKKCCVKEYKNNVFRPYGLEHEQENEDIVPGSGCRRFYRQVSKTVDTDKPDLLSGMGTYEDEVHYVTDAGETGLCNHRVIGLFIFLPKGEREFIIKEDQLHKIVASFLPVFVRAEIIIVEEDYEIYELGKIQDPFKDRVHGFTREKFKEVTGTYIDAITSKIFIIYKGVELPVYFTNNIKHRTFHSHIDVERSL